MRRTVLSDSSVLLSDRLFFSLPHWRPTCFPTGSFFLYRTGALPVSYRLCFLYYTGALPAFLLVLFSLPHWRTPCCLTSSVFSTTLAPWVCFTLLFCPLSLFPLLSCSSSVTSFALPPIRIATLGAEAAN